MDEKIKIISIFILKNIVILFILAVAIFLGVKFYKKPLQIDNPQLIEKTAMNVAIEFLKNKELFLEYELCEPSDNDALFKEKINQRIPLIGNVWEGTLYPTTYSVKVASYVNVFGKTEYVSCKAKVYSKAVMQEGKIVDLYATGLVFSEPITNEAANGGVMEKISPTDLGNGWIIIVLEFLFIAVLVFPYAFIIGTFQREIDDLKRWKR